VGEVPTPKKGQDPVQKSDTALVKDKVKKTRQGEKALGRQALMEAIRIKSIEAQPDLGKVPAKRPSRDNHDFAHKKCEKYWQ